MYINDLLMKYSAGLLEYEKYTHMLKTTNVMRFLADNDIGGLVKFAANKFDLKLRVGSWIDKSSLRYDGHSPWIHLKVMTRILKTIPWSSLAGSKFTEALFPECRPIPLKLTHLDQEIKNERAIFLRTGMKIIGKSK